ncbi:hypothetical protein DQ237_10860 [Blastococcus sp. TF02-8]|nr:hypothetical protein DQ237_10860 [Blastococcus sp. TF02-8]
MDSPSDFLALPEAAQEELLALFTDAFPDFPEFEDPADALAAFLKLLLCSEIPGGEEPPPTTTPPTKPITQPTVVTYANCDDARARGAAPVYAGQPGYGPHLDSDSDGIGCEQETVTPVAYTTTTSPQLAYTGFDAAPFVAGGAALVALGTLTVLAGSRRRS